MTTHQPTPADIALRDQTHAHIDHLLDSYVQCATTLAAVGMPRWDIEDRIHDVFHLALTPDAVCHLALAAIGRLANPAAPPPAGAR